MNDGGCVAVQIDQAAQQLPSPGFENFVVHMSMALTVPAAECRARLADLLLIE